MSAKPLTAEIWIEFLRSFTPQAANTSQVDERNRRYCKKNNISPFSFDHPYQQKAIDYLTGPDTNSVNVILLTGTAGDGKTRIAHVAWEACCKNEEVLHENENYFKSQLQNGRTLHLVRDMSALKPDEGEEWKAEHLERLKQLCEVAAKTETSQDIFLIATNDGQFLEAMRALQIKVGDQDTRISSLLNVFENLLLDGKESDAGFIRCINMSTQPSSEIFDLLLKAFLEHPGWETCIPTDHAAEFFGPNCYIRKNLEILKNDQFKSRLRSLILLCDLNDIHITVREIFILLTNAILGNTAAQESSQGIPKFSELARIIHEEKWSSGSIYSNALGGNLRRGRGRRKHLYEALDRFQIGHETTNIIDTMLIFGKEDPEFAADYGALVGNDAFYGSTKRFAKLQKAYLDAEEDSEGNEKKTATFSQELVDQRRRLFFTLPDEREGTYPYWALTVFRHANEYLKHVVEPLTKGTTVRLALRKKLALGINRIFIGLLVDEQNSIYLATSATHSQARVSRMIEKRLYVDDRDLGTIQIEVRDQKPALVIRGYNTEWPALPLTLTRFEFILRVADGALPTSFSKECFEDIAAFKTQLLSHEARQRAKAIDGSEAKRNTEFHLLQLTSEGKVETNKIELESSTP